MWGHLACWERDCSDSFSDNDSIDFILNLNLAGPSSRSCRKGVSSSQFVIQSSLKLGPSWVRLSEEEVKKKREVIPGGDLANTYSLVVSLVVHDFEAHVCSKHTNGFYMLYVLIVNLKIRVLVLWKGEFTCR